MNGSRNFFEGSNYKGIYLLQFDFFFGNLKGLLFHVKVSLLLHLDELVIVLCKVTELDKTVLCTFEKVLSVVFCKEKYSISFLPWLWYYCFLNA